MSISTLRLDDSSCWWFDRKDINEEHYNNKFSLADDYLRGVFSSDQKKELKVLKSLLIDPTTFCYLNFRLNGSRVRPYTYQDLVFNDTHRFIYFRCARQMGKSLALDLKAARNILLDHGHNHNECIISRSLPQSGHQMRRVKQLLNTMINVNWEEVRGTTDSMSVISVDIKDDDGKTKYSNLLVCIPATESGLGYDFHEVNLDEYEYWDTDCAHFFNNVIQPTISSTNGRISIFTNPNGSDTHGAELEKQRLSNGELKFHTYVFNYWDKPSASQEEFDMLTTGLTRQEIESQYLAVRSISDRNYFTPDEIERSRDKELKEISMIGKQPFFFLDVGAKHDASVLTAGYIEFPDGDDKLAHLYIPIIHRYPIGYPISRVVGSYDEKQDSDGWHHEKSVKDYYLEWSNDGIAPVVGVDVTGNSGISPLFDSCGLSVTDITFSGPSKSGYYQRFKYFMEKGLLHRIPNKQFDYEASHLEVRKSARGYLLIHHESEKDHDDVMDSVCGLLALADPLHVPASMEIIGVD